MENQELNHLKAMKEDVGNFLKIDSDLLREKMKNDPDEILGTMRAGFLLLYSILDKIVSNEE